MTLATDVALAPVLLAAIALAAGARPAADLVVTNARAWTGDPARPEAEALAVIGERIVAVGSKAEIEAWHGPATRVIDASGRRVLPGFNDSHVHFFEGSARLAQVKLKDARSPEELARRIAEHARALPRGEWVLGGTWDDQAFERPRLPTRQDVDALTPETPVFVERYDGHMALANGVALRLAGITARDTGPGRRRDRPRREGRADRCPEGRGHGPRLPGRSPSLGGGAPAHDPRGPAARRVPRPHERAGHGPL